MKRMFVLLASVAMLFVPHRAASQVEPADTAGSDADSSPRVDNPTGGSEMDRGRPAAAGGGEATEGGEAGGSGKGEPGESSEVIEDPETQEARSYSEEATDADGEPDNTEPTEALSYEFPKTDSLGVVQGPPDGGGASVYPDSEMPGNKSITWELRRQVPFFRNGGVLNRKETAVGLYLDGELFPPALMMSLQRGIYYWLTLGLDIGGSYGVFQALLRIKQEMARTRRTNFFFWGWHIRTGYKYVEIDFRDTMSDDMFFQDNSWVLTFENTVAFRFGRHRRRVLYINTVIYGDFDLGSQGWQTDTYVFPATVGFESILGRSWSVFVEGGVILSINGWETEEGVIHPDGDQFPFASLGVAYRFGGVRTALPEDWRNPTALPMR